MECKKSGGVQSAWGKFFMYGPAAPRKWEMPHRDGGAGAQLVSFDERCKAECVGVGFVRGCLPGLGVWDLESEED